MSYVRFRGRLGNQLFQYAFARGLGTKKARLCRNSYFVRNGLLVKSDGFLVQNFNIKLKTCGIFPDLLCSVFHSNKMKLILKILLKAGIYNLLDLEDEPHGYIPVSNSGGRYFCGYWQNLRYFRDKRADLLKELTFKGKYTRLQKQVCDEMRASVSVAISVRRGDYLSEKHRNWFYYNDEDYYFKGIKYFLDKYPNCSFFISSDDIEWCKKTFENLEDAVFLDSSVAEDSPRLLIMLRQCRHFIIANSTFSWWAAWLADSEGKEVIAPKNWFYDKTRNEKCLRALIEDDWILM